MRLLLDTHVLIWWFRDNPRLGSRARALISDRRTDVLFSCVSCWEATIKARSGKLEITGSELWRGASAERFSLLRVEATHIESLEGLSGMARHGDPFDHLLLAQAKAEGAAIMTKDAKMADYGIPCIGVR